MIKYTYTPKILMKRSIIFNKAGIKNLNDPHAFIEYSSDMNDVLEDINSYNKKRNKKSVNNF